MLIEHIKVKHLDEYEERFPYGDSYAAIHYDESWEGSLTVRFSKDELMDRDEDFIENRIYDILSDELNIPRKDIQSELGLTATEESAGDSVIVTVEFQGL